MWDTSGTQDRRREQTCASPRPTRRGDGPWTRRRPRVRALVQVGDSTTDPRYVRRSRGCPHRHATGCREARHPCIVMARADLLIDLVRAARTGTDEELRSIVESVIAEEESKQHHLLADRLRQALQVNGH